MTIIKLEIPDEISDKFDNISELQKTIFEDFVIEQRQNGNISLGKAAELLNISYTDFFDLLGKKGLSFINAPKEKIDESYEKFNEKTKKIKQ